MPIVDEVLEAVQAQETALAADPSYASLKTFYDDMLQKGLIAKPEYKLPQTDTIGRNLYQQQGHGTETFR